MALAAEEQQRLLYRERVGQLTEREQVAMQRLRQAGQMPPPLPPLAPGTPMLSTQREAGKPAELPRRLAWRGGQWVEEGQGMPWGAIYGGMIGTRLGTPMGLPGMMLGSGLGAVGGALLSDVLTNAPEREPEAAVVKMLEDYVGGLLPPAMDAFLKPAVAALAERVHLYHPLSRSAVAIRAAANRLGIPLWPSQIRESGAVRWLERLPTHFGLVSGPVRRFAERGMQAAEKAAKSTLGGRRFEEMAEAGAQAKAEARQIIEQVRGDLATGIRRIIDSFGVKVNAEAMLEAVKKDVRLAHQRWRASVGPLFDATEAMTGDVPVVKPQHLMTTLAELLGETAETMRPLARGTAALGKRFGLTEEMLKVFPPAMRGQMVSALSGNAIPFWAARRIESWLGEASRFDRPIGSLTQGAARALYQAIRQDIKDFMLDPQSPPGLPTALAEAKQAYKTGVNVFRESINRAIYAGKVKPIPFIRQVFKPKVSGGSIENILDVREVVTPDTWRKMVATWLADLYDRATPQTPAGLAKFAKLVRMYNPDELDIILGRPAAEAIQALATQAEDIATKPIAELNRLINRGAVAPEQVVPRVFQLEALTNTRLFREVSTPDVWERARQTFFGELFEQARQKVAEGERRFMPTVYAELLEAYRKTGQLRLILSPHPGETRPDVLARAAEQQQAVQDMLTVFKQMGAQERLIKGLSGEGRLYEHAMLHNLARLGLGILGYEAFRHYPIHTTIGLSVPAFLYGLGRLTTSGVGQKLLLEGLTGKYSGPALQFATRLLSQAEVPEVMEQGREFIRQQLLGPEGGEVRSITPP